MQFLDEWLVPTVEPLLAGDALAALRLEVAPAPVSLWETAVQRRLVSDDQVLGAIATRFRLPIADLSRVDSRVTGDIPEQLARRFTVVPLGQTDSYLEVATANPFDIDAEKMLAFATGREVRMLLASANRDAEVFANPDSVYLTRSPNPHVAFGAGIHYCLGGELARLEGQIAISTIVRRFPNLKLATDELTWRPAPVFRGLEALPLTL